MTWTYRNPNLFPVVYQTGIVQAATSPDEELLLYHATSHSDAQSFTSRFRWFKWCVQQIPENLPKTAELLRDFKFRTKIKSAPAENLGYTHIVWITAQPKLDTQMLDLNPHLADIFDL